jgi:hypothetical protein
MLLRKNYTSRWPWRLGLLSMLVLLGLAWHFYLERVAFYDLSFQLFTFLRKPELFIQNRRFVAAITQLPPIWAVRAGWTIDHVLRLYSVAFVGYYLAVYVLSAKWFKNEQVALAIALLYVLLVSTTFYWAQSEMPQALAALLLFYAGIARQAPVRWRFSTLALAALIPVFVFGYPLAIFPFLFLWAYDWLLNRRWRDWLYYGMLALALATYAYRTSLIPPGSYEASANNFLPNLIQFFPHYFELASFREFWHLIGNNFVALPILLGMLTVYYLLWQRNPLGLLRLALVWVFMAVYTLVINISFPNYGGPPYLENVFSPLAIFVSIPFAMELLPGLASHWGRRGKLLGAGLLAVVLAGRLVVVYQAHDMYTGYQQWLGRLLAYTKQFPERRFLMDDINGDPHHLRAGLPGWASSYETMLLSTRPSPDSAQVVLITNELPRFVEAGKTPGMFLATFDVFPSWELPAKYLRLPNPEATYHLLNTPPPADTAALGAYIAARYQAKLEFVELPKPLKAGGWRTVRIRIVAPAGQPLHSGLRTDHPTLLRSQFLDPSVWPTDTEPVEVPLEVDVAHPWLQDIPVSCPTKPGKYLLQVSLFSRGYRDWPVQLRLPVEVK